jgi:hypothetical protein
MDPISYDGFAYRQSSDPSAQWIVSFVAPAEEIRKWAGIPRRAEGSEFGFQRIANDKRVERAKEFFRLSGNNQSPTSIILGVHPVEGEGSRRVTMNFTDSNDQSTLRKCKLLVEYRDEDCPFTEVVASVRNQIELRLANLDSVDDDDDSLLDDEEESTETNSIISEDEEDSGEIEIGKSLMRKFLESLNNDVWCEANREGILEISKPATVIDGQHRLLGAAACERNIPFTVCAIIDCPWEEQVFQFTVVNYTSNKVPDQFVTANAALSLTKSELGRLEDRLIQAGVKVVEYELMKVVNFDDESPFFDLVNLTEKPDHSKIGYKTMVRVAKAWYSGNNQAIKLIIRNLYPELKKHEDRTNRWKEDDWGHFFLAFWKQVKVQYQGCTDYDGRDLMGVGSNLMIAIVLLEVQSAFLTNLNAQDDDYFEIPNEQSPRPYLLGQVEKRTEKVLDYLPKEFFEIEWGTKSLNTSAGRKSLQAALRSLIDTKGRFGYKTCKLVTGDYGND